MKNFKVLIVAFFCISLSSFANDGSSGCGPGWYIFKENSMVSSALRAITNGVLFPISTLGITFGTSNCTQHKVVKTEKQSLHFATMNYMELKSQMAQGEGEYLSAFAQTIGCQASAQNTFNDVLKTNFSQIVPRGSIQPEKLLLEVYKKILSHPILMRKCSLDAA